MKAIIFGKRYDTTTATLIGSWSNGCSRSDFKHEEGYLYRTKSGAWFLHEGGGPLTCFAEPCGNNGRSGSERIRPVTAAEALAWLEEHELVAAIEEHFASEVQDA